MPVGDFNSFEVLPGAGDLALLVWMLKEIRIDAPLGFPDEFEFDLFVFIPPKDAPIRIVITDESRKIDAEERGELEVEDDVVVVVEPADEVLLDVGVILDEIVKRDAIPADSELLPWDEPGHGENFFKRPVENRIRDTVFDFFCNVIGELLSYGANEGT